MLNKPPITVLQSLASLEGNNDFERVCEWIQESLDEVRYETSICADEVRTRWFQGASQALAEFLEKKRAAGDILRKMK